VKFNDGMWEIKKGVTSHNAEQIRDVKIAEDGARVHLYAVNYREDHRGMDGPTLDIDITSPLPDIIRIQAVHFKGGRDGHPADPGRKRDPLLRVSM